MKKISTIDLTYENQLIKREFLEAFSELYDSNLLISAPLLESLEEELARYCGTNHCCLTGAGSMALQVAAKAIGIEQGDEIVVPANSFLASAVAVHHAGAEIVLADVDPLTWNLSAETVRRAITPRTRAICLVHLYGNVADPAEFAEFGLPVIEDASHAFGGTLRGKPVGSLGAIAGFSAGPIKGFGGLGHAGFITYNQDEYRRYIVGFVNNGQTARHYAEYIGHNFRIDPVNALFLQKKLSVWDGLLQRKKEVMAIYDRSFDEAGIRRQGRIAGGESALWVYVVRLEEEIRDQVAEYLRTRCGIETLVQYTYTINQLPIWGEIAAAPAQVPLSEQLSREVLSLPVHAGLSVEEAEYVASSVIEAVRSCRSRKVA